MNRVIPAAFTLDELLAHLRADAQGPEGYLTRREWAARFGIPQRRMLHLLRQADQAGILRKARAERERIDGQIGISPVYSFAMDEQEDDGGET